MTDLQVALKAFMDHATPDNAAEFLKCIHGGMVTRLTLYTPEGGEMDFDFRKSDQVKKFEKETGVEK